MWLPCAHLLLLHGAALRKGSSLHMARTQYSAMAGWVRIRRPHQHAAILSLCLAWCGLTPLVLLVQVGTGYQLGGRTSSTGVSECTTSLAVLSECSSLQV